MGVIIPALTKLLPVAYAIPMLVMLLRNAPIDDAAGFVMLVLGATLTPVIFALLIAMRWLRELPLYVLICEIIVFVPTLLFYFELIPISLLGGIVIYAFFVFPIFQLFGLIATLVVGINYLGSRKA